jgi:hypothetical protein
MQWPLRSYFSLENNFEKSKSKQIVDADQKTCDMRVIFQADWNMGVREGRWRGLWLVGNGFVLQVTKCDINKFTVSATTSRYLWSAMCRPLDQIICPTGPEGCACQPSYQRNHSHSHSGNALTNIATNWVLSRCTILLWALDPWRWGRQIVQKGRWLRTYTA